MENNYKYKFNNTFYLIILILIFGLIFFVSQKIYNDVIIHKKINEIMIIQSQLNNKINFNNKLIEEYKKVLNYREDMIVNDIDIFNAQKSIDNSKKELDILSNEIDILKSRTFFRRY